MSFWLDVWCLEHVFIVFMLLLIIETQVLVTIGMGRLGIFDGFVLEMVEGYPLNLIS